MRETETREIDGFTFAVMQLPATRATKMWWRLAGVLVPAASKAAGSLEKLDLSKGLLAATVDLSSAAKDIGEVAAFLAHELSPEEFDKLIKEFAEATQITFPDGTTKPFNKCFDDAMAGHVETVLKFLVFAMEVNFRSFFKGAAATAGLFKAKAAPSPNTSENPGPGGV